ncbi:transcriptional regulator [Desulfosporosinus acidiphilus SJ4]|uniref:Transcriptional regulator n=1 Tax=Desulfosporosinus acidiphilus (strain DSM 22704 / JCM 16185 / SJ4) TaxID=646529 RepID=I4D6A5_DESAJ|nr:MarR family transcriptional regulator [Desulfosporosinus acidiphilus]AFM41329.1 transcriptional regulator [Desulfosporosinus acidiphilus SJ4]
MKNEYLIGRYISTLYRYGQSYSTKRLETLNIGSGYGLMMRLYRQDGQSQEELSNFLKIDKGTTAKTLKRLEDEGYLLRKIDEKDRRAYKVFLTPKGYSVIPEIQSVIMDWENLITSGFNDEEIRKVEAILRRMAENAANYKIELEEKEREKSGL